MARRGLALVLLWMTQVDDPGRGPEWPECNGRVISSDPAPEHPQPPTGLPQCVPVLLVILCSHWRSEGLEW